MLANIATKFENYVAVELFIKINLWNDATGEDFKLHYIRDKRKKESDFLITKNDDPWLLVEAKNSDSQIEKHHLENRNALGNIPLIQVCREDNVCMQQKKGIYRISASRFFV